MKNSDTTTSTVMGQELDARKDSLSRIYLGIVLVLAVTFLLMFGSLFFTVTIGILEFGITTTFGLSSPMNQLVANTLEIVFIISWLFITTPMRGIEEQGKSLVIRRLLRMCLILLLASSLLDYLPIFGTLHPSVDTVRFLFQLLTVLPSLAIFPLQLFLIRRFAKFLGNEKIYSQALVWVWYAPLFLIISILLAIFGHQYFFWLIIVVVLLSTIQYWNLIEGIRRGLKGVIQASET